MSLTSPDIPGYAYGSPNVGFSAEHEVWLRRAGDVLADQTTAVVDHWRGGIIAGIPHLARHSRAAGGGPLPDYLVASNRRFRQSILDTCRRPYEQDWLNYQHEIVCHHTTAAQNRADGVAWTPFVPLRDGLAFVAVVKGTVKPHLAAGGDPPADVDAMHGAWCKSLQLQVALWAKTYIDSPDAATQW